jgi:hypothetical protein
MYKREDLMPKRYPQEKPSEKGHYIVLDRMTDTWREYLWDSSSRCCVTEWELDVEWFIPIRLDKEDDVSEVIWQGARWQVESEGVMNEKEELLEKHQELLRQRGALFQQLQKINSELNNCENKINAVEQKIYELLDSEQT